MNLCGRKVNRWKSWDYSNNGWYFVTICVQEKGNIFGNVVDQKIVLNEVGKKVEKCWREIINHFNNIRLDEFIIMPDHLHGIINVGVAYMRPVQKYKCMESEQIGRSKMYLSLIIQNFKAAATREIRMSIWHRSFYDRIIRSEKALGEIRRYIRDNPKNWQRDRNFD